MLRLAFVLTLLPTLALADVTGPARVIDGDTIEVAGEPIRLHGIDAPEGHQACERRGVTWQCGAEAGATLRRLVGGVPVRCDERGRDWYGRLISVCRAGGVDLNARMVATGMALAYRKFSADYVGQETRAKAARIGMWAGRFVAPWDWRRGKRLPASAGNENRFPKLSPPGRACCKFCKKGKACGDSCISRRYTCRELRGCACNG